MIKLNETPVRTSRNFNINNIKIEDIEIPEIIEEFSNIDIIKESENIEVNSNVKDSNLIFGLSEYFTNLVNEKSNLKLKLEISDKCKKTNRIIRKRRKNSSRNQKILRRRYENLFYERKSRRYRL